MANRRISLQCVNVMLLIIVCILCLVAVVSAAVWQYLSQSHTPTGKPTRAPRTSHHSHHRPTRAPRTSPHPHHNYPPPFPCLPFPNSIEAERIPVRFEDGCKDSGGNPCTVLIPKGKCPGQCQPWCLQDGGEQMKINWFQMVGDKGMSRTNETPKITTCSCLANKDYPHDEDCALNGTVPPPGPDGFCCSNYMSDHGSVDRKCAPMPEDLREALKRHEPMNRVTDQWW